MLLYEAQNSLEKDFVVAHRDINRKFPMHIHKSFELVAVTEGELTLITDSGSFNIKKGTHRKPQIPNRYAKKRIFSISREYLSS